MTSGFSFNKNFSSESDKRGCSIDSITMSGLALEQYSLIKSDLNFPTSLLFAKAFDLDYLK